jgi:hypothetical protein
MAKFGLFQSGGSTPIAEYEGDMTRPDKFFIHVVKYGTVDEGNYNPSGTIVASVRPKVGQEVRKISD